MTLLLAALAVGVVVYFAAGFLTGFAPRLSAGARLPNRRPAGRQVWLLQAGTELSAPQFVAGSAVAGAVSFLLLALVTDDPLVAVVPAVAVALLPRAWFGHRRTKRIAELQRSWPDGLRHIIGGIESGLSVNQAIATLASSGPEPLRGAFDRFALRSRMLGVPAALELIKQQLADPTSDRVLEVLLLAHERGGRIVTAVLSDLADATSRDLKAIEGISSDRLEPKINSRAVFVLPWLVLVALCASPGPIRAFYQKPVGGVVIGVAAAMSFLGILIVERLSRDPAEERVFGGRGSEANR